MTSATGQCFSRAVSRRAALGFTLALVARRAAAATLPVVTILGDSITAGLGLVEDAALPSQLARALERLGMRATVRGAGVSGDTSAGGLARLDFSVQPDTAVCVVALGGNDILQGLAPEVLRANLAAIVRRLQARQIRVVLAGISVPPAVGPSYAREAEAAFREVARAARVPLVPDLLAGVGPALRQADGLHPDAAGVRVIAARLAPVVRRALLGRR